MPRRDSQGRELNLFGRPKSGGGGGGGGGEGGNQPPEERLGDTLTQAPDFEGKLGASGDALVAGQREGEENKFGADVQNANRADDRVAGIQSDKENLVSGIEDERTGLAADALEAERDISQQKEDVKAIPGAVNTEFNQLRTEFAGLTNTALDRVEGQAAAALGDVMKGQNAALQSAVQGIQGNVNSQVSQIQGNPNLTSSQKQNMIVRVRMQGAQALIPAVGQTVLAFNTLRADTATKFAQIDSAISGIGLQGQSALAGAQGNAFSQAQVEVGRMTSQLIELDVNSDLAFSNGQNQLLATRQIAEQGGNDLMLQALPAQDTPYWDPTGSLATQFTLDRSITIDQFKADTASDALQLRLAMIRNDEGSFTSNLIRDFLGGLATSGSVFGGALQAGAGAFDSFGNTPI